MLSIDRNRNFAAAESDMAGQNQHWSLCDHEGLLAQQVIKTWNILFGDPGKSENFPTCDLRISRNGAERVSGGLS